MVQNCKSFLDPSIAVANFERIIYDISKECLRPKPAIIVEKVHSKQCNKWMNDDCFKAKKEFIKTRKEFLKFPSNMGRCTIYMNIKKRYKKTLYLAEKAFKEKKLLKLSQLHKKDPKQFFFSGGGGGGGGC